MIIFGTLILKCGILHLLWTEENKYDTKRYENNGEEESFGWEMAIQSGTPLCVPPINMVMHTKSVNVSGAGIDSFYSDIKLTTVLLIIVTSPISWLLLVERELFAIDMTEWWH